MRIYFTVFFCLAMTLPARAEVVEAANLNEALEKVPCEHFKKNDNGTWSLTEVTLGANKSAPSESLIVTHPQQVGILEKRCPKP
jgi:hypothetical protein